MKQEPITTVIPCWVKSQRSSIGEVVSRTEQALLVVLVLLLTACVNVDKTTLTAGTSSAPSGEQHPFSTSTIGSKTDLPTVTPIGELYPTSTSTESPTASPKENCPEEWERVPANTQYTIFSADFVSGKDGWAVGLGGIYRWNGKEWNLYDEYESARLNAVTMLSATNGWIVGSGGTILHWDGNDWMKRSSPTQYSLNDVFFLSENEGWAVGGFRYEEGYEPFYDWLILKWDGKKWFEQRLMSKRSSAGELIAIQMFTPSFGWAVGDGPLLVYNGSDWVWFNQNEMDLNFEFYQGVLTRENAFWLVGFKYTNKFTSFIKKWNGESWENVAEFKDMLETIAFSGDGFGLAGGGNSNTTRHNSLLVCWDGTVWKEIESPSKFPIRYIWTDSPDNVWLFSGGDGVYLGDEGEIFRSKK